MVTRHETLLISKYSIHNFILSFSWQVQILLILSTYSSIARPHVYITQKFHIFDSILNVIFVPVGTKLIKIRLSIKTGNYS